MQLTDAQKQEVATWISNGAKLSEVQQRLGEEFGIRLTYMEARFLIDDLKLVPQEKTPPVEKQTDPVAAAIADAPMEPIDGVQVHVDEIMRPGALVSGNVTFTDGVTAEWSLDQVGRFSMIPSQPGYRPSTEDFAEFRKVLERALSRKGL